ncbi:MAG: 50S ribosomal protein L23 [Candidatus Moranbacteria bacterium RIFCSPHIGHO2_01_FULL_55_24]|nr:MAG: 50S ribosomal protein L23 [Candidatus Moranbacteria bacterium RIFCSPHIGHO2_01_FULL_55_24]
MLLKPRITEKSYALNANGQYVFEVAKTSTKQSITQAVQEAFGVNVTDVRVVNLPGKSKAFGKKQIMGKRSGIKKALVQLAEGQSIELFKGGL